MMAATVVPFAERSFLSTSSVFFPLGPVFGAPAVLENVFYGPFRPDFEVRFAGTGTVAASAATPAAVLS
jgi:hypothetical protein